MKNSTILFGIAALAVIGIVVIVNKHKKPADTTTDKKTSGADGDDENTQFIAEQKPASLDLLEVVAPNVDELSESASNAGGNYNRPDFDKVYGIGANTYYYPWNGDGFTYPNKKVAKYNNLIGLSEGTARPVKFAGKGSAQAQSHFEGEQTYGFTKEYRAYMKAHPKETARWAR